MSKIYSRPRIKLPKIFITSGNLSKSNSSKKKISKILVIFIIAFITARIIYSAIIPIFDILCKNKAQSIATIVSNNKATEVMKEHTYDEFFLIEKDNNGNITMIKSNVGTINEVISDVAVRIDEGIKEYNNEKIYIPFGSFTGIKFLSGTGPKVRLDILSDGNVKTDLRSEFISQGINQTLHRVYLQVDCQVRILTPFEDISTEISNQVLIAENIIVGNIPSTFYNLEGINGQSAIDIIE